MHPNKLHWSSADVIVLSKKQAQELYIFLHQGNANSAEDILHIGALYNEVLISYDTSETNSSLAAIPRILDIS
jgi:hypothetical protein